MTTENDFLGFGLTSPFRRGAQDFATASDIDLVRSSIRTILGATCASETTQGEIPFNQALGTLTPFLRHENMDDPAIEDLARFYVVDALRRNEPRIKIKEVRFIRNRKTYTFMIRIRFDLIDRNVPGNRVFREGLLAEVEV